jgi:hypothetical protein
MVGGGVITLLFELSDGIGWALLVFGACFLVPAIVSAIGLQSRIQLNRPMRSIVSDLGTERKVESQNAHVENGRDHPDHQPGYHGN